MDIHKIIYYSIVAIIGWFGICFIIVLVEDWWRHR